MEVKEIEQILKLVKRTNASTALVKDVAMLAATAIAAQSEAVALSKTVAELQAKLPGVTAPTEPRNTVDESERAWREKMIANASELTREWGIGSPKSDVQAASADASDVDEGESLSQFKDRLAGQAAQVAQEWGVVA